MNADGTGQIRLTNHRAYDDFPRWNATGTLICFSSQRGVTSDTDLDIYTMKPEPESASNVPKRITFGPELEGGGEFSPDGAFIYFTRGGVIDNGDEGQMYGDIWRIKADGSGTGLQRFTFANLDDNDQEVKQALVYSPRFNAAGTGFLASIDSDLRDGEFDASDLGFVLLNNPHTGDSFNLPGDPYGGDYNPAATAIAFIDNPGGSSEAIFTANPQGANRVQIFSQGGEIDNLDWGKAPVVASAYSVSGRVLRFRSEAGVVTPFGIPDITVTLGAKTQQTNADGTYSFAGIANGTYTLSVTPPEGTVFDPASRQVVVNGANVVKANFRTYLIQGRVFRANASGVKTGFAGAQIFLNGELRATTDENGMFLIPKLGRGQYTVRARGVTGWTFAAKTVNLPTSGIAGFSPNAKTNFLGTKAPAATKSGSGANH